MNSPPCARQRESLIDASKLDSKATYGSHQISHMGAILWWQLQVASLTLPVICAVDDSIYLARLKRPHHCGKHNSVTLENVGSIT